MSSCYCLELCIQLGVSFPFSFAFHFDINFSKIFLDPPPKVMKIKTKINKWEVIKLKSFEQQRKSYTRQEENSQNGRK